MAEKLELSDFVTFSDEGKKILSSEKSYVAECSKHFIYQNGIKTDEVDGTTLTIQIDRGEKHANSRYRLVVPEVFSEDDVLDRDVNVVITDAKVYASSAKGSTFAGIKVSLKGHIEIEGTNNGTV